MGSNCGCGAGGNKARSRPAGFHLPAWMALDAVSLQTLGELAPSGPDADTAVDYQEGSGLDGLIGPSVAETSSANVDSFVDDDDESDDRRWPDAAAMAGIGGHKVCTLDDCEGLGIDIIADHQVAVRDADLALRACTSAQPPRDCSRELSRYILEFSEYADAETQFQTRCVGMIYQGITPPDCRKLA